MGKTQGMSRYKLKSALVPYGFITPATLTIVLLVLYPIMYGVYISFFDTNLVNKWNFVGLKYYIQALTDSSFLHSLWKTLVFTCLLYTSQNTSAQCEKGHKNKQHKSPAKKCQ